MYSEFVLGLYCSGWIKRGPIGVIVSTMNDGFETGKSVADDLNSGMLRTGTDVSGGARILDALKCKGKGVAANFQLHNFI